MNKPSSYELIIINILKKENINFEREKQFKDLHYGYYRYDFYLPNKKILIEVDGEQHFKYIKRFHKKKEDFLKGRERDRRKNAYSLANEIPLYRIPFWDINNMQSFEDIIQQKFLVKSKWHNDDLRIPKK